jgi:hypothetical protein
MNYGMFTEAGNALIHGVVIAARAGDMEWDRVVEVLTDISTLDGFEEAYDTEVRERVFAMFEKETK